MHTGGLAQTETRDMTLVITSAVDSGQMWHKHSVRTVLYLMQRKPLGFVFTFFDVSGHSVDRLVNALNIFSVF